MKKYWLIQGIMIPDNDGRSSMYQLVVDQSQSGDGQMFEVTGYSDIKNFEIDGSRIKFTLMANEAKGKHAIKFDYKVKIEGFWSGIFDCENGYSGTTNCVVIQVDENFFQSNVERTYVQKAR